MPAEQCRVDVLNILKQITMATTFTERFCWHDSVLLLDIFLLKCFDKIWAHKRICDNDNDRKLSVSA